MRDGFPEDVKNELARRAAFRCSNPDCGALTVGPQAGAPGSVNVGVAAHISAASEGGPRFDPSMSSDDRRSARNGIHLCQTCAKWIDSDPLAFTSALLHRWKTSAEACAFAAIGKPFGDSVHRNHPLSAEEVELLIASAADGELFVHSAEQLGNWVCAGTTHYSVQSDPAYARLFLDALKELVRRGLAARDEGNLFSLTSQGFRIARVMRDRQAEMPEAPLRHRSCGPAISSRSSPHVRAMRKRGASL